MPKPRWLAAAAFALVASDAHAVGTRTFDLDTLDKLSGGEQKGTAITSSGEVIAGWESAQTVLTKATSVWSALARPDASVLLGVGPEGRVLKVDAAGRETVVAETGSLAVTSIVEGPGGKIYAATMPNGEIFVVDPATSVGTNPSAPAAPKPKAWATLPSDHVWALVYDKKRNELFAGTGPDGKIYRVDAAGKSQVFYKVDDTQVVSLAMSPGGTLYAGTSSKGLLLAINAAGRGEVVQDFTGNEVKAIVVVPARAGNAPAETRGGEVGDAVYAIVNEYPTPPEPPRKTGPTIKAPGAAPEPPRPQKGKGELWKITGLSAEGRGGKPERMTRDDATHYFALDVDPAPRGGAGGALAYVGTANEGRVVSVDDTHATAIVAKVDARQIGVVHVAPGGAPKGTFFASSDAAVFHRITGVGSPDATWTSKVLDAGLRAHFGRMTWRASGGPIELQTRTGGTSTPDDAWGAWSTPLAAPGKVQSPPGRFVQLRARWKGNPAATLRSITLAFVTDNLRAIVTDVSVPSKGALPTGIPASGTEVPAHTSSVKLSWKVDNPDNDALRYRLWYRREESAFWRPITREDEPLSSTDHTWSTEALAEGWYRVRVEASDEIANPVGAALKHALDSATFVVDNTPPVIRRIALVNGRLQAEVVDGVGPIARLEVEVDGSPPWRPVAPADGILDEATEQVDAPLGIVGNHVVALRAYDAAGNSVTREVEGR